MTKAQTGLGRDCWVTLRVVVLEEFDSGRAQRKPTLYLEFIWVSSPDEGVCVTEPNLPVFERVT